MGAVSAAGRTRDSASTKRSQAVVETIIPRKIIAMEQKSIEEQIAEYEEMNGIILDAHNRATFRAMVEREDKEVANEEREHSHSPVGDWNNAREVQD